MQTSNFLTFSLVPGDDPRTVSWPDTVADVTVLAVKGAAIVTDRLSPVVAALDTLTTDDTSIGAIIPEGKSVSFTVRTVNLLNGALYFASANTEEQGPSVASVFIITP